MQIQNLSHVSQMCLILCQKYLHFLLFADYCVLLSGLVKQREEETLEWITFTLE